jgi:hypothetical protein
MLGPVFIYFIMIEEVTKLFEQLGADISINEDHVWAVFKTIEGRDYMFSVYTEKKVFSVHVADNEGLSLDLIHLQEFHNLNDLAWVIKNNRPIKRAFPQWIQGSILSRCIAVS